MRLIFVLLAVITAAYASVKCVLNEDIRKLFLDFHNGKREEIAKGRVSGFGSAKNMYKLRWSCTLERRAKKSTVLCPNKLESLLGLGGHGANMVYMEAGHFSEPAIKEVIKQTLDKWWEPAKTHRLGEENRYSGDGNLFNVANIINSESTEVGCSYSICPMSGNKNKLTILCLYDDVAYLRGRVLYDNGKHCKKNEHCTTYRGSTCDKKTGLCERPEDTANDYESNMCRKGNGMTDKMRNTFLNLHNDFRSRVASGKAEDKLVRNGKGFAPIAASMLKMEYNCDLEEMAAKYARGCVYEHSSEESRKVPGETYSAGENLFTVTIPDADNIKAAEWASKAWFRELKDYGVGEKNILTRALLDRSKTKPEMKIGHYTQMVWGKTDRVGCAIQHCYENKNKQKIQTLVVCNYLMGGNFVNGTIYEIGKKPCERCPTGYKCENKLCAKNV